jgi:hypothetical protein
VLTHVWRAFCCDLAGEHGAKSIDAKPHAFVADINARS